MNTLVLIRHGESRPHVEEITGGWTDSDLTRRGEKQAGLLAERLSRMLDGASVHLGSSDLRRAWHTAKILGKALDLKPEVYPLLRDLNNGIAAGKTHAEARQFANEPSEPYLDWQPYPQAESWRQFFTRVVNFMDGFSIHQPGTSVLVSHAAVIHVQIAWWLGLTVDLRTDFEIDPGSLTMLRVNRWGECTVERLNDTAHLFAAGLGEKIGISKR